MGLHVIVHLIPTKVAGRLALPLLQFTKEEVGLEELHGTSQMISECVILNTRLGFLPGKEAMSMESDSSIPSLATC